MRFKRFLFCTSSVRAVYFKWGHSGALVSVGNTCRSQACCSRANREFLRTHPARYPAHPPRPAGRNCRCCRSSDSQWARCRRARGPPPMPAPGICWFGLGLRLSLVFISNHLLTVLGYGRSGVPVVRVKVGVEVEVRFRVTAQSRLRTVSWTG